MGVKRGDVSGEMACACGGSSQMHHSHPPSLGLVLLEPQLLRCRQRLIRPTTRVKMRERRDEPPRLRTAGEYTGPGAPACAPHFFILLGVVRYRVNIKNCAKS